jgi:Uri superfamily endonuclease
MMAGGFDETVLLPDGHLSSEPPDTGQPTSAPGTYALILALNAPVDLKVGRLGLTGFELPCYVYFGSAHGPGGLKARINHHLQHADRPHWHVDYLRRVAAVHGVWYTCDPAHLECHWAIAALGLPGAKPVPGFGSSDCSCRSHLVGFDRPPGQAAFRRQLKMHWAALNGKLEAEPGYRLGKMDFCPNPH